MRCGCGACLSQNPPHLSAPEVSHSLFVRGLVVAPRPPPDPGHVWAPSDCIPDPPHSPRRPQFTIVQVAYRSPAHANPGRLTKTPMPSTVCDLRRPVLGCMRERRTLCNLLHECWSRSSNSLPVSPSILQLHNNRHPCPFTERSEERANWPSICKPPKVPTTKGGST